MPRKQEKTNSTPPFFFLAFPKNMPEGHEGLKALQKLKGGRRRF
jgi:hypothetical protein